jgi:hypothetical protein
MKNQSKIAVALMLLLSATQLTTWAQSTAFTYQGRLSDGGNAANGVYDLRFRLASDPQANTYVGSPVLSSGVVVSGGLVTVSLDFGPVFTGSNFWLEVDVRTNGASTYTALSPLQSLTSVPYALYTMTPTAIPAGSITSSQLAAGSVGTTQLADGGVTGAKLAPGSVTPASLGLSAFETTFWQGNGNSGTSPDKGNFIGTTDNQPLELWVDGARALRIEPNTNGAPNMIGGAPVNFVDPGIVGATISGGGTVNGNFFLGAGSNHVAAIFGTIAGGRMNTINADHGFIGGGIANTVQLFAYDAVIGGGVGNAISTNAYDSVIVGGNGNVILNDLTEAAIGGGVGNAIGAGDNYTTIGGGGFNTIQGNARSSTISGGAQNTIAYGAIRSTIAGGINQSIGTNSDHSTISGGEANIVQAGASHATIVGGYSNIISNAAVAAAISGGSSNLCGGNYATVPGGHLNSALGSNSFAAGSQALATGSGSFVWNSFPNPNYAVGDNGFFVFAPNGFSVDYDTQRSDGGGNKWVYIGDGVAGFLVKTTIAAWNSAYLSDGGTWTSASDRARKANFAPVDVRSVLDKVAALPVQTWNYTNEPASMRHLGPVAQDFHNAFGLNGPDDLHIADLDESGVALAAIQGLNQKLEAQLQEKRGEISDLRRQMQTLEQRLERLEKLPLPPPSMNSAKN